MDIEEKKMRKQIKETVAKVANDLSPEEEEMMEEALKQVLLEGKSPKEAMGFDEKTMNFIYGQAYRLYTSGNYQKAEIMFKYLTQLEPRNPTYVKALAGAYQEQEKYDEAIQVYHYWTSIDLFTPFPHYLLGEIYRKIGNEKSALFSYGISAIRCENNPDLTPLKERAELNVKHLENKLIQEDKKEEKK